MRDFIKSAARDVGFGACGITTTAPVKGLEHICSAIAAGRIASMSWIARTPARRCDPCSLLPGARSVICCALAYGERGIGDREGGIDERRARFARGDDYHEAVRGKLAQLWARIVTRVPSARAKLCVDSSPILEKALAARAGLGWIGKHTVLVNRALGSWFVLGEVLTDLAIEPDEPALGGCGACRRCLDACPTGALPAAHTLDARRCISYLTLASSEEPPEELRRMIPEGADGCDRCQEACPYNDIRLLRCGAERGAV